jgi:hypothetical protein
MMEELTNDSCMSSVTMIQLLFDFFFNRFLLFLDYHFLSRLLDFLPLSAVPIIERAEGYERRFICCCKIEETQQRSSIAYRDSFALRHDSTHSSLLIATDCFLPIYV